MNEEERKRILLDHYAEKPIRRFLQIDASQVAGQEDDVVVGDRDGDVVFTAIRDDLQASDWDIRVRIPLGTNPKHLGRLLHKIACYLKTLDDSDFKDSNVVDDGGNIIEGAVLGPGAGFFNRVTGTRGDEGESYPGWYDYGEKGGERSV